jgi:hypothetical protein
MDPLYFILYWPKIRTIDGATTTFSMVNPTSYNNEVYKESDAASARVRELQNSDEGRTRQFTVFTYPLR